MKIIFRATTNRNNAPLYVTTETVETDELKGI